MPVLHTLRKKKRQTLEEEESMDDQDFAKLKDEAEKDAMPTPFDLPEDTVGTWSEFASVIIYNWKTSKPHGW